MAYSDFTLERALRDLGLRLDESHDLYAGLPEVAIGGGLREILAENMPLALANCTEKARSELIVSPVLIEVRRLLGRRIAVFSGAEFNVDPSRGLNGVCDFILTRSPLLFVLTAPVMTIVEAQRDNINSGLGQCVASMYAAQLFNARDGGGPAEIAGAVTTGVLWRFLRLEGDAVLVDRPEYNLDHLGTIIAALMHAADPALEPAGAMPG